LLIIEEVLLIISPQKSGSVIYKNQYTGCEIFVKFSGILLVGEKKKNYDGTQPRDFG